MEANNPSHKYLQNRLSPHRQYIGWWSRSAICSAYIVISGLCFYYFMRAAYAEPFLACRASASRSAYSVYEETFSDPAGLVTSQTTELRLSIEHADNPGKKFVFLGAQDLGVDIRCADGYVDIFFKGFGDSIKAKSNDGSGIIFIYHLSECLKKPSCVIRNHLKNIDMYTERYLQGKANEDALKIGIEMITDTLKDYRRFLDEVKPIVDK